MIPPRRRSTLFPYTTLFRSLVVCALAAGLIVNASPRRHVVRRVLDRKSTRLNSSHRCISYAVFCLKKKKSAPLTVSYSHPYFPLGAGSVHAIGTAAVHAARQ